MPAAALPTGILVLGAAGSGTSTLGRALAARLGRVHLELDDFVWQPTDPPYTALNPPAERARALRAALTGRPAWVLAGSPGEWCAFVVPELVVAVFLEAPVGVRLERLKRREAERFGALLDEGQPLHARHVAFLTWAAAYDHDPTVGRSRRAHEAWLATLPVPVLRLDGTAPVDALVGAVVGAVVGSGVR